MLIAELNGERIDAAVAHRETAFRCPICRELVILRRGRKVVAHFAHKPRATCIAKTGETRAHLEAKRVLLNALKARALRVEAEYVTVGAAEDRRADLMVWSPASGIPVAIELQHSRIPIPELEARAASFARARIAQLWVPFLDEPSLDTAVHLETGGLKVDRYPIPLHVLWMSGLVGENALWMYQASTQRFWHARFRDHMLMTKETLWYEMSAIKRYRRGGERRSRRFRTLYLQGPWSAENLRLSLFRRAADASAWFRWPKAQLATFVPATAPESR